MPALIYWSIPLFVAFIAIELALLSWRRRRGQPTTGYELTDTAASLSMGVGNLVVTALWKTVAVGLLFLVYQYRLFEIEPSAWWAWALLLVGDDFCYYWFHRFSHRVRAGWAGHVNHHSSTYYNLSTALRQSWTSPFFKVWFYLPLALLGFHPLMIVAMQAVSLLYQFWIHTETIARLGPLEWVLNTPSHHRVHHGANAAYVDRNYGGILIVWDRLFGTFAPERVPVHYGLRKSFHSRNPFRIAFHEWAALLRDVRRTPRWRHKLRYFLMPPDWRPPSGARD